MIYFLIIMVLVLCIADYIKNRNILSPGFVFNLVWFVTLVLYQFKLSYIQQNLSIDTIFIFSICVATFNIAIILANMLYQGKKIKNHNYKISTETKLKIACCVTILIFIIEVIYSKGTPLIWKIFHINKTYFDFGIPSVNGFLYCSLMLLGAYAIFKKSKTSLIYLVIGILALSRQVVLSILIEGILCILLSRKGKIKWWKLLVTIVIVFFGFSLLGNFRSGSNTMNNVFKAKTQYKNLPTVIKWPYSYMTFSLSNFNNLVSQTDGLENYGITTLNEFLPSVIQKLLKLKEKNTFGFLVSPNYTVSTYLPSIYIDFGILGVAVFNTLLGIVGLILYKNVKINKSDRNLLLYSVFIHNIMFLFFSNMFLNISVSFQFLLILILFNKKNSNIGG